MLKKLRDEVCTANASLPAHGLVIFSEGNVSALSSNSKYIAIKPSGVPYEKLRSKDIVIVDRNGKTIYGSLKPSTDLPTHLEIYKHFPFLRCIVHTHSPYATIFAQKRQKIPCLGTTHADNFCGDVPVTKNLSKEEIQKNYEVNTGKAICRVLNEKIPAVLVANHGPFVFGKTISEAINNAVVLEKVAFMAINGGVKAPQALTFKHFSRKHGSSRYYGQ